MLGRIVRRRIGSSLFVEVKGGGGGGGGMGVY